MIHQHTYWQTTVRHIETPTVPYIYTASHKDPCWARCCTFCTQRNWAMWLLSTVWYHTSQIGINGIPLQSTTTRVAELAHDLGVVIDSKLYVSTCSGAVPVWFLSPASTSSSTPVTDTRSSQNTRPGIYEYRVAWTIATHCFTASHGNIRKVQSVQNAAARLLTGTRRGDHISPVSHQLHWLPVQRRVDFKLACFVFSSLSGQAPSYLADDIHLVSEGPRRRLRSSTNRSCAVPRTHNTFGDRNFAVAGPRVWNSLP